MSLTIKRETLRADDTRLIEAKARSHKASVNRASSSCGTCQHLSLVTVPGGVVPFCHRYETAHQHGRLASVMPQSAAEYRVPRCSKCLSASGLAN